jgi:hypothetical protein
MVSTKFIWLASLGILACGGAQPEPVAPTDKSPGPAAEPSGASTTGASRPELTAQACEASGGTVVGDIGDGAIHRADYMCPNGVAPSGSIRAPEGGPIAIEGSVCCPK